MPVWNPWHGCTKISPGCLHCYVYRTDALHDKDASRVVKNRTFNLPLQKKRDGTYRLQPDENGLIYTCFSSDFFHEAADDWRHEIWDMIRLRQDATFLFITKRIHRFADCVPADWGDGYSNVHIGCTVENQDRADYRLPLFLNAPIRHRTIICEPLLERVNLSAYLSDAVCQVIAGGESGESARPCDFAWVLALRDQCKAAGVPFQFKQTGANFIKNGRCYRIPRRLQHHQARRANINYRSS